MVLSRFELPAWAMRWLHYVPISVMAALIGQELFLQDGQLVAFRENIELWAALPTFIVAFLTRSLLGTVVVGVLSTMLLRYFFSV